LFADGAGEQAGFVPWQQNGNVERRKRYAANVGARGRLLEDVSGMAFRITWTLLNQPRGGSPESAGAALG
jgi:hypothetical protein